jgi:hypothetical protein
MYKPKYQNIQNYNFTPMFCVGVKLGLRPKAWVLNPQPSCGPKMCFVRPDYIVGNTVTLYDNKYLSALDIGKQDLLMLPAFSSSHCFEQLFS